MKLLMLFIVTLAVCGAQGYPVIDDTPTRVQTTLDPGLDLLGTLRPKSVHEIGTSRWSVDCAGTDREHADYHAFKEYLEPLGIRRLRTQSGWARCEKERGRYDFAWLDSIVFDAAERGLEVWLETSYGNPLYPGGGGRGLGAGLPRSPEALRAWDRWVEAMAKRYRGTVRDWCIWNEPDLSGENGIDAVIRLALRSARIIKREIPDARLAACAITKPDPVFAEVFCRRLRDSGQARLFTWFGYHHYTENPDDGYDKVEELRAVVEKFTPELRLWQNESGVESEWCRSGALSRMHWTELKQAKWILRRTLADLGRGNETAVFHIADLDYRASTVQYGLCRYGLLKTEGQVRSFAIDKVKTAYYAVQNAVSVFNDAVEKADVGAVFGGSGRHALYTFRTKADGVPIAVFWNSASAPSDFNATEEIELTLPSRALSEPVWVDVLTGNVWLIPPDRAVHRDGVTVYRLPFYDSPVFVTDRRILDLEFSEYAKHVGERLAVEKAHPVERGVFFGPHSPTLEVKSEVGYGGTGVSKRALEAKDGRFDFAPFADGLSASVAGVGVSGSIPDIAGSLVFRVRCAEAAMIPVFVRCDWFWRFFVNGSAASSGEGGEAQWKRVELGLCAGDNEILFHVRPGNSGRWFADLRIGDGSLGPKDFSF